MKIKSKMLIYILVTSAIIYIVAIGFVTIKSRQLALNQVTNVTNAQARESANLIKSKLEVYLNITKTLAKSVEDYKIIPFPYLDTLYLEAQRNVIEEYPEFYAVGTSFELNAIDTSWEKDHGRRLTGWFRGENGVIQYLEKEQNLEGDDIGSAYHTMKTTGDPMVVDPEMYSYTGDPEDEYMNSNFAFPIMHSNQFIGLAGIDVDLKSFQEIINEIEPFENSFAYLLSNDGTFAAHPKDELLGKKIENVHPQFTDQNDILNNVEKGKSFSLAYRDEETNQKYYYSFAPVEISEVDTPWSIVTIVPYDAIQNRANQIFYVALTVGIIGLILISIVIWVIANNISKPIEKVTHVLKSIAKGKIDESLKTNITTNDEISEMAMALNTSIDELNKKAEFANHIGQGNFEHEFELPGEEDHLGKSLIDMRDSLVKAKKEEEKRKVEDEKRRWINEGLTKFSDILRQDHDDLDKLTYNIIQNLIEYLGAVQGGLFLLNDEDKENIVYELKAAYAYDRQKFLKKHIKPGEGLIGSCVLEKKTIYMTQLPQDYMEITSGLGDANPDALLIVPLKTEEEVLGVLEIASFNKFEDHQRSFVEKVAESIASTLSSVKVNIRTSLLLEKSQQQAEEMAAQEEEMRQNMEELQATQEESARRENQLTGIIDAIDNLFLKAEIDTDKNILNINELFTETFGYKGVELKGNSIEQIIPDEELEDFRKDWEKIMNSQTIQKGVQRKSKTGEKISLVTSYSPIKDKDGNITKVLMLALNINQTIQNKHNNSNLYK
ncbi:MAG: GAF domain-containing protein [Bacteroidales bacterium]